MVWHGAHWADVGVGRGAVWGINTNTGHGTKRKHTESCSNMAIFLFLLCSLVRFYFVFALPGPILRSLSLSPLSLSLSPYRAETYKQRRKFAIKAKVHIELECFAFYVA